MKFWCILPAFTLILLFLSVHSNLNNKRYRIAKKHNKIQTKACTIPTWSVFTILKNAASKATQSLASSVKADVVAPIALAQDAMNCKKEVDDAFKAQYQQLIKEDGLEEKLQGAMATFETEMSALLSEEENVQIVALKEKPRELCNKLKEFKLVRTKQLEKLIKRHALLRKAFETKLVDNEAGLRSQADCWWGCKSKIEIYEKVSGKDFKTGLPLPGYEATKTNRMRAEAYQKELITEKQKLRTQLGAADSDVPECDQLPLTSDSQESCAKIGFGNYIIGMWRFLKGQFALKDGKIKACLALSGVSSLVSTLLGNSIEKILSILAKILGPWAIIQSMKILYYATKLGYYIYKAIATRDKPDEASGWVGNALGTSVKIVEAILFRRKMRKLRKLRRMKRMK